MSTASTPAVRLRPALPADLPVIHDLIMDTGLSDDRALITARLEGCTYWLATAENDVLGTIGLEHGVGVSLLRSAAVRPEVHGRGIGWMLSQTALRAAQERGDRAVYLFSTTAGPFWARFGFRPVPVPDLIAALPDAPQVRGGLRRGWIHADAAWRLNLPFALRPSPQAEVPA